MARRFEEGLKTALRALQHFFDIVDGQAVLGNVFDVAVQAIRIVPQDAKEVH